MTSIPTAPPRLADKAADEPGGDPWLRRALIGLCLAALIVGASSLYGFFRRGHHSPLTGAGIVTLVAIAGQMLGGLGIGFLFARRTPGSQLVAPKGRGEFFAILRLVLMVLAFAVGAVSIAHGGGWLGGRRSLESAFFNAALTLGLCLAAYAWLRLRGRAPGWLATLDIAGTNIIVIALVLELGLSFMAARSHSPLFWDKANPAGTVAALRGVPGEKYFGKPLNAGGFHDDPFHAAAPGELKWAIIGDSFGFGIVPFARNFIELAELKAAAALSKRYPKVALDNYGIRTCGPREYWYLYEAEVEASKPSRVALAIFVGNDINVERRSKRHRYLLQDWWLLLIPKRIMLARKEQNVAGLGVDTGLDAKQEYLDDPNKERPTFSEQGYAHILDKYSEYQNAQSSRVAKRYRNFFRELERFHGRLKSRLVVLILPSHSQVEEPAYKRAMALKARPKDYRRELPQERIGAWCRERGVPCLDLLPVLRTAAKTARVYHRRDSHWNSAGNRVAGAALADFIIKLESKP